MPRIGVIVHGKCFGLAKITEAIEIQYISFLQRVNTCLRVGWRVCVEWSLVAHSPMGQKIISTDPNAEWFLSRGGSLRSHKGH